MSSLSVPPLSNPHPAPRRPRFAQPRSVVVASADASFRERIGSMLAGLRWQVRQASSGAEAWSQIDELLPEAFIVDSWLPDLESGEMVKDFLSTHPEVDLLHPDGTAAGLSRCAHRAELLYVLRSCQETDTVAWNTAPEVAAFSVTGIPRSESSASIALAESGRPRAVATIPAPSAIETTPASRPATGRQMLARLPELIGNAPAMLEIGRRVRLVAPRSTPVLIEGPTGSGKELVAQALHRLSPRCRKPFVAINCAAIPEALLEAELFGHTRGAFTGAVQGRVGRIEAADGGTLFLDEIGEMPLALQSKLLRFVECGELQRVGDNEAVRVNVRIIAATHRPLVQHTQQGSFRADLYYRLAVFMVRTPALAEHIEDLPALVEHFLEKMGREEPVKQIDEAAMTRLAAHGWPGNVRELEHVLERAAILAEDAAVLTADAIEFGQSAC